MVTNNYLKLELLIINYKILLKAAAGLDSKDVAVWDLTSGQSLLTLKGHGDTVLSVKFINSNTLASGSCDPNIKIWSLSLGSSSSYTNTYTFTDHTDCVNGLEYLSTGFLVSLFL